MILLMAQEQIATERMSIKILTQYSVGLPIQAARNFIIPPRRILPTYSCFSAWTTLTSEAFRLQFKKIANLWILRMVTAEGCKDFM